MAMIAMAVYSTAENGKDACLERTLGSLKATVNFKKHRLMIFVNGYTKETEAILYRYREIIELVIWGSQNIGTAEAINHCWKKRLVTENLIKMDDDVVMYQYGWVDEMEEAIKRDSSIGQIALKRKDLEQNPNHANDYFRSQLHMLPHTSGQRWIVVEQTADIMGTCVMHSSALINKVGALYQPGLYGFDDAIMSQRSRLAGFYNCFLPHFEIDHIDEGKTPYQQWKEKSSSADWGAFQDTIRKYKTGELSIYHSFN